MAAESDLGEVSKRSISWWVARDAPPFPPPPVGVVLVDVAASLVVRLKD